MDDPSPTDSSPPKNARRAQIAVACEFPHRHLLYLGYRLKDSPASKVTDAAERRPSMCHDSRVGCRY